MTAFAPIQNEIHKLVARELPGTFWTGHCLCLPRSGLKSVELGLHFLYTVMLFDDEVLFFIGSFVKGYHLAQAVSFTRHRSISVLPVSQANSLLLRYLVQSCVIRYSAKVHRNRFCCFGPTAWGGTRQRAADSHIEQ